MGKSTAKQVCYQAEEFHNLHKWATKTTFNCYCHGGRHLLPFPLTTAPVLTKKVLGALVDTKLTTRQQRALAAKKANGTQVCLRKSEQVKGGDPSPPLSTGQATPGVLGTVLGSLCKGDMELLERVQKRATAMVKGLEHLTYKERLRAVTAQPGEEKAEGDLISAYKYLKGGCKDNGARLFSVVPSDRARSNGHKLKHKRVHQTMMRHFFFFLPL
ncbi:hypothetical protein QYF61_001259 [Mycteria americana]|uniref:Uncharacterized protein n=1 Tax=Mycteria americana TaxID=33587 RepID=A0AAN7NNA7_MYCAM|nr:hypothetical protein QYF61_001259 [Mycteria americana]